jgi:hypothetical protein
MVKKFWQLNSTSAQFSVPPIVPTLFPVILVLTSLESKVLSLPSRTQSLKAAIVFDRDVTVKASSKNALNLQNLIKTVNFLVSTLFFSRTMCLGFTITASWSKMPLIAWKLSFTSEVKFLYLLFLRNFYFVNHLNNTKSQQMLLTS